MPDFCEGQSGVPNVIDPLGGSYYVETLTTELEREAETLFTQIEEVGRNLRAMMSWLKQPSAVSRQPSARSRAACGTRRGDELISPGDARVRDRSRR